MAKEYIERETACKEVDKGDLLVGNNAEWAKEIIYRTPAADVVEAKHGRWESYLECGEEAEDGYYHHRCSVCKREAFFEYEMESFYDENDEGEMQYAGELIVDIDEHLTDYCPNCGAKMDGE